MVKPGGGIAGYLKREEREKMKFSLSGREEQGNLLSLNPARPPDRLDGLV